MHNKWLYMRGVSVTVNLYSDKFWTMVLKKMLSFSDLLDLPSEWIINFADANTNTNTSANDFTVKSPTIKRQDNYIV